MPAITQHNKKPSSPFQKLATQNPEGIAFKYNKQRSALRIGLKQTLCPQSVDGPCSTAGTSMQHRTAQHIWGTISN
jgi:hypothetical protein